ncbi:hypothetical protein K5E_21430 [Enterococcus thailandicus]|nr:hypothetical protein [Enterococcus thailandicus]GMC03125.1 hypothetical protein K4E_06430 [Enterococcus thailandicus]GMC10004.1 hypothetical protein K5E_21430 [Enterococcus thailandicus]
MLEGLVQEENSIYNKLYIKKEVELVDINGKVISKFDAVNTNW